MVLSTTILACLTVAKVGTPRKASCTDQTPRHANSGTFPDDSRHAADVDATAVAVT